MARPKTKSSLVEGVTELVEMMRNIDTKLSMVLKGQERIAPKRGRGRPKGTIKLIKVVSKEKKRRGRPPLKKGPGRPPGRKNKK